MVPEVSVSTFFAPRFPYQTSPRAILPAPLFVPPSQTPGSMVRQAKFVADLITGGGNVHSTFSAPSVQLIRAKPSLFNRLGARIKDRGLVLRLGAPPSPPART